MGAIGGGQGAPGGGYGDNPSSSSPPTPLSLRRGSTLPSEGFSQSNFFEILIENLMNSIE